jgi:hypothetical protein
MSPDLIGGVALVIPTLRCALPSLNSTMREKTFWDTGRRRQRRSRDSEETETVPVRQIDDETNKTRWDAKCETRGNHDDDVDAFIFQAISKFQQSMTNPDNQTNKPNRGEIQYVHELAIDDEAGFDVRIQRNNRGKGCRRRTSN